MQVQIGDGNICLMDMQYKLQCMDKVDKELRFTRLDKTVKQFKIIEDIACALDFNNNLFCWNFKGFKQDVSSEVSSGVDKFALGLEHICAISLKNGMLKCQPLSI